MQHVIDSAIFDLSFGQGSSHWPDELELARIVETELMPVVSEVFDERSRTGGGAQIARLEVDLGSVAFDGSWRNLRERIREGVRAALAGTNQRSGDRPGAESSLKPAGFLPATGFDLLAHFLRFGVLPQDTQLRGRHSLDKLLRDVARVEPQRLAALVRDDAIGGMVATRLVRQFSAALVRQVVETLDPGDVPIVLRMIARVSGQTADSREADDLTGDGSAVGAGAPAWRVAIAAHAGRVDDARVFYRQVRARLVSGEPFGLEADTTQNIAVSGREQNGEQDIGAPPRPLSGSERLFRGYDLYAALVDPDPAPVAGQIPPAGVIDRLARDHPQQFQRFLLELRSGLLRISLIAARLSKVELHRLLQSFVMPAVASADADRQRFLLSIDEHAGRVHNGRVFQLQVLQRLIDGELIDLEAIASDIPFPAGQDVPGPKAHPEHEGRSDQPAAAVQIPGSKPVAAGSGPEREALRDYLGDGVFAPGWNLEALRRAARRNLGSEPGWFTGLLRQSLTSDKTIARLIRLLPERLLTRALYLLSPAVHERMQCYADAIANACYAAQTGIAAAHVNELKWQCCFQHLLAAGSQWDTELFVQRFADLMAAHTPAPVQASHAAHFPFSEPQRIAGFLRQSLTGDRELTRLAGSHRRVAGDLNIEQVSDFVSPATTGRVFEPETTWEERHTNDVREIDELFESGIRIANAGQILVAPYLPRLFGILDLVEDGVFKHSEAQRRAVHLLQFLVDESSDTPEYGLVLNKILCGLERVGSVNRKILVSDAEREAIEGLLRGMIQNWKALGRTSVNGLRESFLQREGRLRLDSDGWHLMVEAKAFDILLDSIPWSFAIIKHAWMKEVIYVDWR